MNELEAHVCTWEAHKYIVEEKKSKWQVHNEDTIYITIIFKI